VSVEAQTTKVDLRQEIRFAVVMYGGVSLAIYINGVAQELFNLVRATAFKQGSDKPSLSESDEEFQGTVCVYRKLGQILGMEEGESWGPNSPIRTRFTVDILSGTSAGGINAVYLAKALANGQTIDQLARLWVEEGDILKLINDAKSVEGLDGLKVQKPPKSLLNSQRMYRKLLDALDGMEKKGERSTEKTQSPYVEELDLFVTATDFRGLPIRLQLLDEVVEELRHRHVFRFRYADERSEEPSNDFHADNNPFLAYAARCTSSFPFAFDPMALKNIDDIVKTVSAHSHSGKLGTERDRWQKFFPEYRQPSGGSAHPPEIYDFTQRAFVDGGYLDNKPFGHAIDALASRNSGVPVDRKLIYIDPSPERSTEWRQDADPPNPVENVAAAFSLARYETIREDLQRVLARNRLITRVESIVSEREQDVKYGSRSEPVIAEDFAGHDLKDMIRAEGVAYGGYHRLKLGALTDDLAMLIARVSGFDLQSDEPVAVRYFVREWRKEYYRPDINHSGQPDADGTDENAEEIATENAFLLRYDLAYRIRRLDFVLNRIDHLYALNGKAKDTLTHLEVKPVPNGPEQKQEFQTKLRDLRDQLDTVLAGLRAARAQLELPGPGNPLAEKVIAVVKETGLDQKKLRELLEEPTEELRSSKARSILLDKPEAKQAFRALAARLEEIIQEATVKASEDCGRILGQRALNGDTATPADAAVAAVRHYYDSYDHYDMISYPILYSTEVGDEIDAVDVLRVSPEDATTLIDERDPNEPRRKLAGTSVNNFGAFLDRGWRRNDILWGRLDAAERIITVLLPGEALKTDREDLLEKAQLAILEEEFVSEDRNRLLQLIADALATNDSDDKNEQALRQLAQGEEGAPVNAALQAALRSGLTKDQLLDFFRDSYEVNRNLSPQTTLKTLSRSTRVVGEILEDVADDYGKIGQRPATWMARFGRVFWGLVEVSIPRSIQGEFFRYWLVILYLFEALLIAVGTIFVREQVQALGVGVVALGATAVIHFSTLLLRDYMVGKSTWLRILIVASVFALLFFAVVGADTLFGLRTRLLGFPSDG
jgi:patatin-related protein